LGCLHASARVGALHASARVGTLHAVACIDTAATPNSSKSFRADARPAVQCDRGYMSTEKKTPSEKPYDASNDPDADPEELTSREKADQPSQAEGEDHERD